MFTHTHPLSGVADLTTSLISVDGDTFPPPLGVILSTLPEEAEFPFSSTTFTFVNPDVSSVFFSLRNIFADYVGKSNLIVIRAVFNIAYLSRSLGKVNLALLNVLVVNKYGVFIVCALTGNLVCLCAAV